MTAFSSLYPSGARKYSITVLNWVVLSVVMLGEVLTLQLVVGAAISLGGVFVILIRPNRTMPEAALGDKVRGKTE